MKKTMKKKILPILTIVLTLVMLVCAMAISANAKEATTPSVSIDKFNLVFDDNVYLKYAVKFDGVEDEAITSENIGMLYFNAPQADYTEANATHTSSVVGYTTISGEKYYTFEYRHITAKQMTDYVYSVAYIDVDGVRYYSSPNKFSVLEYAYSKLGKTGVASDNEDFKAMLESMLDYGANAQKYFGYNTDRLANADYYLIEVIGGVLEDGFTKGLYNSNETATLTAPETNGELIFVGWQNSTYNTEYVDFSARVEDISKNEVYTAIYGTVIKYSTGLSFDSNGDGTCDLSGGGTCSDEHIIIPPVSPDGDIVTSIGYGGSWVFSDFHNSEKIKSVTIPENVSYIIDGAFYGCESLSQIIVSEENPYFNTLDGNLYNESYSTLIAYANKQYDHFDMPNSVTKIGYYAFQNKPKFSSINIPASLTDISADVFRECYNLEQITVDEGHKKLVDLDGVLYSADRKKIICYPTKKQNSSYYIDGSVTTISDYAFNGCTSLSSINIPNTVTYIGSYAFKGCTSLVSVSVPNNVSTLGSYAFSGCKSLANVTLSTKLTTLSNGLFNNCISLQSLSIPSGITTIGSYAFSGCVSLTGLSIPSLVSSIGSNAFMGCTALESINIPTKVTTISSRTFENCTSLKSITIPNYVTSIGSDAFRECMSLSNVTIGSAVTTIDSCAFFGCSALVNVTIPKSVTSIGWYAFVKCTSLKNITVDANNTKYKSYSGDLYSKDGTILVQYAIGKTNTTFTIPSTVTTIGEGDGYTSTGTYGAFSFSQNLISIVIPDSVQRINRGAFSDCAVLSSIAIPKNTTSINSRAFVNTNSIINFSVHKDNEVYKSENGALYSKDGTNLFCVVEKAAESFNIPSGVLSIQNEAFKGYTALKNVIIPNTVTTINSNAFENCTSLESVIIPSSVSYMSSNVFANCTSLKSVTMLGSITSINRYTFENCTSLESIVISKSVVYISSDTFLDCISLKNVYFQGTEEEWTNVTVYLKGNDYFTNANVYYNYVFEE